MARLIDLVEREAVKDAIGFMNLHFLGHGENKSLLDSINEVPTVDAVPVVRCKDCKWYEIAPIDNVPYCCHESGYCGEYMPGLFYCANGERKDNGED